MSDIRNKAAHEWRQLCQAAFVEFDPEKLFERIAKARNAVLDRIEDGFSRPSDREEYALRGALETLATMQKMAERDIGKTEEDLTNAAFSCRLCS